MAKKSVDEQLHMFTRWFRSSPRSCFGAIASEVDGAEVKDTKASEEMARAEVGKPLIPLFDAWMF